MKKDARGQRGKVTEKAVEALLTHWNEKVARFAWHRFPDTRASRGLIQAQPADYLVGQEGRTIFLEAKETGHAYRITKAKVSQLPTLWKWELAGTPAYVLVHHTGIELWRVVRVLDLPAGYPSWDLSSHPEFSTAEEALTHIGLGPENAS